MKDDIFKLSTGFVIGMLFCFMILKLDHKIERHNVPFVIVQDSFTLEDNIDCMTDENCMDQLLFSDLPQRKDATK